GIIWSWKNGVIFAAEEQRNSLPGHTSAVVSLKFDSGRLFCGSIDGTIKVWDGSTLPCLETFYGHEGVLMSLLLFVKFQLLCSLDCKIKVWSDYGEVMYTNEEADDALVFHGVVLNGKPMLLCSWKNNFVGVYELPSFVEKGRMYTKGEVRSLGQGLDGLVFTGDVTGLVIVWRLTEQVKLEQ
ncbi:Zinc finger CCCH domain-containing protein 17, partial [Linum grandiflorum]